jgi:hypothetical protein
LHVIFSSLSLPRAASSSMACFSLPPAHRPPPFVRFDVDLVQIDHAAVCLHEIGSTKPRDWIDQALATADRRMLPASATADRRVLPASATADRRALPPFGHTPPKEQMRCLVRQLVEEELELLAAFGAWQRGSGVWQRGVGAWQRGGGVWRISCRRWCRLLSLAATQA